MADTYQRALQYFTKRLVDEPSHTYAEAVELGIEPKSTQTPIPLPIPLPWSTPSPTSTSTSRYASIENDGTPWYRRWALAALARLPMYDTGDMQCLLPSEAKQIILRNMPERMTGAFNHAMALSKKSREQQLLYILCHGFGSVLAKPIQHPQTSVPTYEVNLRCLNRLEVRRPFLAYGTHIVFTEHQIISVQGSPWEEQCSSRKEQLYCRAVATMFMYVTVCLHAGYLHLGASTKLRDLELTKPLRNDTHMFVYGTRRINASALRILLNNRGILHRMFGLTYDGLLSLLMASPTEVSLNNELPATQVLRGYHDMFRKMVDRAVPEWPAIEREERARLYFEVTALHEHLGTMGPYLLHDSLLPVRLWQYGTNESTITRQELSLNVYIAVLTSARVMPMFKEFVHCSPLLTEADLEKPTQLVEEYETPLLHPKLLECSVSL
jgi:hypothetical protein